MKTFEEVQKALKIAFAEHLTPSMKEIFPNGNDEDIAKVVEVEFTIFDQIGQLEEPTEELVDAIYDAADEKSEAHYVALREANNLSDLDEDAEEEFSQRLSGCIREAFEESRDILMAELDPGSEMMNSDDPRLKAMIMDMFSPSEPGAVVMEVGFGIIDAAGNVEETIIDFPGGIQSSDKIH